MIWGCFRGSKLGPLYFVERTMDSQEYINVLESKLKPFYERYDESIFQDDSAPCHRSTLVNKWKAENSIRELTWPGYSPDLNPIEHLWAFMKKKVVLKCPYNKKTLIDAIKIVWENEIPETLLENLSRSMESRIAECIKANGFSTKYILVIDLIFNETCFPNQ